MVLLGYIDDSGDGKDILTLSCVIGDSPAWVFLEMEWQGLIEAKNIELVAEGRKPISRFHASDCSCRKGEFEGWDTNKDQVPFMQALLRIVEKYQFDIVAFTIDLKELANHVPAARSNPKTFAHVLLLLYIMQGIADGSLASNKDAVIKLIHDRGTYDTVLSDAYRIFATDPTFFAVARRFCSIDSIGWEDCIALQQADLLAYENYKESRRDPDVRDRRKSLDWILERGKVGGFLKSFNEVALTDIQHWFDGQSEDFRARFLQAARIAPTTSK